jgi:RNA-directed DNA polymerase
MSHLKALKSASSLSDVAKILSVKPSTLSYVLYKKPPASNYTQFTIPKRFGGERPISAPINQLKMIQKRLSNVLQNCAQEINTAGKLTSTIAHGFTRHRSIITNAKAHKRHRYVFNVDLEDFFGSINFGRVRGYFLKDNRFILNQNVATVLAQIICHNNALPQGSPCSPVVSNLIGHVLDIHLVRMAKREGCTYTRYADDLTFSTNKLTFPPNIAQADPTNPHSWQLGSEFAHLVTKSGFAINKTKTRMQYRDSRQEVTGLIVNQKINVRCEYRHMVRAMVQRLSTKGTFEHYRFVIDANGNRVPQNIPGTMEELHGMLAFIDSIDRYNNHLGMHDRKGKDQEKLSSKESLYRRFLLFKEFYAPKRPLIICEGKTDNVYLVHAIRSFANTHPKLATKDAGGVITLNVRFLKYERRVAGKGEQTGTARILGIIGGTANLAKVIKTYDSVRPTFKAPGMQQPVIVVIDNDSGAGPIYSVVKEITGIKPTGGELFLHVTGNLYVVPTPLFAGSQSSAIEDFFDAGIKATVFRGKTFNPGGNINTKTHYGKAIFAHKVVKANAGQIDFSAFDTLLTNIIAAIDANTVMHP